MWYKVKGKSGPNNVYVVTLPNNKKIKVWFIGPHLEVIFKAYNIPYEKLNDKRK